METISMVAPIPNGVKHAGSQKAVTAGLVRRAMNTLQPELIKRRERDGSRDHVT
jgi:hypothetical protein